MLEKNQLDVYISSAINVNVAEKLNYLFHDVGIKAQTVSMR